MNTKTSIIPFDQLDKFTFVKIVTGQSSHVSKSVNFDISDWILKLKAKSL